LTSRAAFLFLNPQSNPMPTVYNSSNVPAHIKTSHAAAKGFSLYAGRHGETAARAVCYGQLATVGFYFFAGCPDLVESELNRAAA
jgi:hypothetical protein